MIVFGRMLGCVCNALNILLMFGREPHTREGFEDAERELTEKKRAAQEHPGYTQTSDVHALIGGSAKLPGYGYAPREYVSSSQEQQYSKAKKRLGELKTQGHKEALDLEEEHEKLMSKFLKAQGDLRTFEKENLGMHQEETETGQSE